MLHPSTQKLIDRLAAMTAQKKIDWIEKDNGDVLYSTEGYAVRLTPEPPRILLSTDSGKALEDATSTVLHATPHAEGGTYGDLIASIARDACREARGTEAAINTLLAGLTSQADDQPAAEEAAAEDGENAEEEGESTDDVLAASGGAADLMEDAGDDTTVLSEEEPQAEPAEAPLAAEMAPPQEQETAEADTPEDEATEDEAAEDDTEAETASEADEPDVFEEQTFAAATESDDGDTAPDDMPDDMAAGDSEDLVDVSVPEAALLDEDETMTADETEADNEPEAVFTYEDAEDSEPAGNESSLPDEASMDDEDDVSGAVARLADEVNASNSLHEPEPEAETEPEDDIDTGLAADADTGAEAEEELLPESGTDETTATQAEADTAPVTPAYSVAPGRYAPFGSQDHNPYAPQASAPADEQPAEALQDAAEETYEDFVGDAPEAQPPVFSDEGISGDEGDVATAAPVWDEAPAARDEADEAVELDTAFAEQDEDGFEDTQPGPDTEPEADPVSAETYAISEDEAPVEAPVEAEAEPEPEAQSEPLQATEEEAEPAQDWDNVVRYVPFGSQGLQAVGSDASDEAPVEEDVDSEIVTAATMMSMPEESALGGEDAPEPVEATETQDTGRTEQPDEPVPASEPQMVTSDTNAPASPEDPARVSLSLSGLSAGLGFGATTLAGFTPSSPRPAGEVRTPEESVTRAPVLIDATDDYPDEIEDSATTGIPDVTNLEDDNAPEDVSDYVEASVSNEGLDPVSPPSEAARQNFEHALSDVSHEKPASTDDAEEPEQAPARPKTRFNPWT